MQSRKLDDIIQAIRNGATTINLDEEPGVGEFWVCRIGAALEENHTLKSLSLRVNNTRGVINGRSLANAFCHHRTLEVLSISNCDGNQLNEVFTSLRHNSSLRSLDLRGNKAYDVDNYMLDRVLDYNATLVDIKIPNRSDRLFKKEITLKCARNRLNRNLTTLATVLTGDINNQSANPIFFSAKKGLRPYFNVTKLYNDLVGAIEVIAQLPRVRHKRQIGLEQDYSCIIRKDGRDLSSFKKLLPDIKLPQNAHIKSFFNLFFTAMHVDVNDDHFVIDGTEIPLEITGQHQVNTGETAIHGMTYFVNCYRDTSSYSSVEALYNTYLRVSIRLEKKEKKEISLKEFEEIFGNIQYCHSSHYVKDIGRRTLFVRIGEVCGYVDVEPEVNEQDKWLACVALFHIRCAVLNRSLSMDAIDSRILRAENCLSLMDPNSISFKETCYEFGNYYIECMMATDDETERNNFHKTALNFWEPCIGDPEFLKVSETDFAMRYATYASPEGWQTTEVPDTISIPATKEKFPPSQQQAFDAQQVLVDLKATHQVAAKDSFIIMLNKNIEQLKTPIQAPLEGKSLFATQYKNPHAAVIAGLELLQEMIEGKKSAEDLMPHLPVLEKSNAFNNVKKYIEMGRLSPMFGREIRSFGVFLLQYRHVRKDPGIKL